MRLLSLRLRGAIGIYEGMGLDEVEIDFTKFNTGLIALCGANGIGKTSILENLQPHRMLASRKGKLQDHFRLKDSYRDLKFAIDPDEYRTLISIDAETGKSEAYIWKNGEPLNDGKNTTYDVVVEKLLGTPELFFRSIFSSQRRVSFAQLDITERKALFFELLGLDRYQHYEEYAKQQAKELDIRYDEKKNAIDSQSLELLRKPQLTEQYQSLSNDQDELRIQKEAKNVERFQMQSTRTEYDQQIGENEGLVQGIGKLDEEMKVLRSRIFEVETNFNKEASELQQKRTSIVGEIERKSKIVAHKTEIETQVSQLQTLRIEEKTLSEKEGCVHVIESEFNNYQLEFSRQQNVYNMSVQDARNILSRTELQIGQHKREGETKINNLNQRLSELEKRASLIDSVPCNGHEEMQISCQFLQGAIQSGKEIDAIRSDIQDSELFYKSIFEDGEVKITDAKQKLAALIQNPLLNGKVDEFERRIAAIEYDANRHTSTKEQIKKIEEKQWEKIQVELREAETIIKAKQEILSSIDDQLRNLEIRKEQSLKDYREQLNTKNNEWQRLAETARKLDELRFQRTELIKKMANNEYELSIIAARDAELQGELISVRNELERLDKLEAELEKLKSGELQVMAKEIERWRLLQKAFSRDGIPTIELDYAGVAVTSITNELLANTFGSRFQIQFETTRITTEGKQRETFEIKVFGNGTEKKLEMLSGGEAVWIDKAISEGISIYLSQKSGKEYLTSYSDEADGPLDPDNKDKFLQMMRESFTLGKRYYGIIISQTPELWQSIPQRIHLDKKMGVQIIN